MGPYCNFCERRCFVLLPLGTPPEILKAYGNHHRKFVNTTIIATCAVGQKFEKEKIGYCYDDIQEALKAKQNGLSFAQLREASVKRCEKSFHALAAWSPADWATAMAGECREACNTIKKMRRIAATPEVLEEQKDAFAYEELLDEAADELADLVTYVDLLAARLGVDLGQAIRRKFNSVSSRVKSDVKL